MSNCLALLINDLRSPAPTKTIANGFTEVFIAELTKSNELALEIVVVTIHLVF